MKPFIKSASLFAVAATIQLFSTSAFAKYENCDEQVYQCHTTYEQQCGYEQTCHEVPGQRECHTTPSERECHTVPGHRECHIVPGNRECHQEQTCSDAPPSCRDVQECGTNALGQEICKTRQVCDSSGGQNCSSHEVCSGSSSSEQCSDSGSTQECGLVPGHEECNDTGSRQQCSNEYRCSQQPKEHCAYETVHKQCYVPDPPPYNPPYTPPTPPPYNPPYTPPTPPPYHPPVDDPPYNPPAPPYYPPVDDPPYNPPAPPPVVPVPPPVPLPPVTPPAVDPGQPDSPIGQKSFQGLTLNIKNNKVVSISFTDKGQSPTYLSRYFIAINDQSNKRVISQYSSGDNSNKVRTIELSEALPFNQSYALAIKVVRTGGPLVNDVTFIASKKLIKQ